MNLYKIISYRIIFYKNIFHKNNFRIKMCDIQGDETRRSARHLTLLLLHQRQHLIHHVVVFGSGVGEDVDVGVWQGDLQGHLDGADAHLGTVSTTLHV